MLNKVLFALPWFVAGGLTFVVIVLMNDNSRLGADNEALGDIRLRYQEQVRLNARQREEFEGQIQQLQSNLQSAQNQMANLSAALQEAREMMEPVAQQVMDRISAGTTDSPATQ